MATNPLNPGDIARTLIHTYGNEAPRRAEILARETFAHNTAETFQFLRDVLKAIDQIRSAPQA